MYMKTIKIENRNKENTHARKYKCVCIYVCLSYKIVCLFIYNVCM